MKNRVNLYLPEFHPKLKLLTLSLAISAWFFAALVCTLVYAYLSHQHQQLELQIVQLEKNKQQQTLLMNDLQTAVNNIRVNPALLQRVEQNQKILTHKNQILRELSGTEGLENSGFSQLMLSLAKHHQEGVWLTHINLDGANIIIEGAANESSNIPKWMNSLSETDYFKGQEFADTRLFRDANEQLNFVIATGKKPSIEKELPNE